MTESGPSDPAFLTKKLTKYKQIMGASLTNINFHLWESEVLNILEGLRTYFLILCICEVGDLNNWNFEISKVENLKIESPELKFPKLKT